MKEMIENEIKPRRAFLIGVSDDSIDKQEAESLAKELAGLAETLGVEIAGQETVRIREKHPRYGMGTGKAEEIAAESGELDVDCLIFDQDLTPSQQRNWEKLCGIPVVDRREVIIQIFAGRAKTREAELQVDLAELKYSLPRLSHKYIDLSRQRGGRYGTKGSGETRLETDRRLVQQRIHKLETELKEVRKHRAVQRKKREKIPIPACALVGYTNAGKSSLLNAMTSAGVFVEDKLFATLDPTTRRLEIGSGRPVLLTDTVGFIRRLPHDLVDAFRSTLEEVSLASILVHVLDASDPDLDRYYETTMAVLRDLNAGETPMIVALNKTDRVESRDDLEGLAKRYPGSVMISAKNRTGLDELALRMDELLSRAVDCFRFPADRYDLPALIHRSGTVFSEKYEENYIEVTARVDETVREKLREYIVTP
ncbi:GTPase HflX [Breznakiella homolactica]|uniref:GTPase HflX n=1 Tax=Breznakiella homolactica TaxID=2798577 RepID=A0A7T7XNT9_9SPIR|nr:GTPase HflX [Breznakiella homolactica]QQO09736.1 GTPase HflX [Breznakiella homolactica]